MTEKERKEKKKEKKERKKKKRNQLKSKKFQRYELVKGWKRIGNKELLLSSFNNFDFEEKRKENHKITSGLFL